jgi:DNA polymerase-1
MFDFTFLRDMGIDIRNFWWDTMFAHHALMAECASGEDEMAKLAGKKKLSVLKKGLGFQTSIYTREPYYKDDGKVGPDGIKDWLEYWGYNAKDSAVTKEIQEVQNREFDDFGSRPAFEIEMSVAEPFMYAQSRGFLIDLALRDELRSEYSTQIDRFQKALDMAAGSSVNVKSTNQGGDMQRLLYETLKLPMKFNRKTKNPTADKDAINELAARYPDQPILKIILKIREYRDFEERYLNVKLRGDRMHCSIDVTGTKSGRVSSRAAIDGSGTNLHTIPVRKKAGSRLRQMFLADPGKVMVVRDFKQAETWIVAYLARCKALIELLNDPTRDIHKETAVRIYNEDLSAITFEKRYLSKRTGHGSNYGLTGVRLAPMIEEDYETTGVRVTVREAQLLIDKYFMIYPEIQENFWHDVEAQIRHSRILVTPLGRKRAFFGDMRDSRAQETLLRDAYSFIPQSTVGDLCNIAVARCYNEIQLGRPELGAEFMLSVHDSIMMQCDIGNEMIVAGLMEECMKHPITIFGETFTIPSDCQIGFNWNKRSKDKVTGAWINPKGLVDSEEWQGAGVGGIQI